MLHTIVMYFTFKTQFVIRNTRHTVENMKEKYETFKHSCTDMSLNSLFRATVLQLRILAPTVEGSLPLRTCFYVNLLVNAC